MSYAPNLAGDWRTEACSTEHSVATGRVWSTSASCRHPTPVSNV